MPLNTAKLKALREELDWTISEAADSGGFGRAHYSQIEASDGGGTIRLLERLADLYEVIPGELLTTEAQAKANQEFHKQKSGRKRTS